MLVQDVEVSHVMAGKIEDLYESEMMGVACQPRCGSCRCGECPLGGKQYTLHQERELAMIDKGLELRKEYGQLSTHGNDILKNCPIIILLHMLC
jgi:hypothetical protein